MRFVVVVVAGIGDVKRRKKHSWARELSAGLPRRKRDQAISLLKSSRAIAKSFENLPESR
jgi:hypothetical protein